MKDISLDRVDEEIALLTLRRPTVLNALSWSMIEEIHAALAEVGRDRSIRALVITGEGRGFCSGIDIRGDDAVATNGGVVEVYDRQERVAGLALALQDLPQPVVAAVNGPAAGGGLAIALAADVRFCSPAARFNAAFVRIGLSGGDVGVSYMLPRIVGRGVAADLLLTGRMVDADEALALSLANRVVEADELVAAAVDYGRQIAANSPFAVRMTKQVLRRNLDAQSLEAAIELENRTQILCSRTEDMGEALAGFLERRRPSFSGR